MAGARYRWVPRDGGQFWSVQPGGIVEIPPEKAHLVAYHLETIPGIDGAPCLIPLDPPATIDAPAPIEAVAVEPEPAEELAPPKRTRRGRGQ